VGRERREMTIWVRGKDHVKLDFCQSETQGPYDDAGAL
jgi:hypothetical protein